MKEADKNIHKFSSSKNPAFVCSFCYKDENKVKPVIDKLIEKGYPVWNPPVEKKGSREWKIQLSSKLDKAYAVILFITQNVFEDLEPSVISQYDEARDIGKVIIPVFIDDVDIKSVKTEYNGYIAQWQKLQGVAYSKSHSIETLSGMISNIIENSSQIKYSEAFDTSGFLQKIEPEDSKSFYSKKPKRNKMLLTAAIIEAIIMILSCHSILWVVLVVIRSYSSDIGVEPNHVLIILILLLFCLISKFILCTLLYKRSAIKAPKDEKINTAPINNDKELNKSINKKSFSKILAVFFLLVSIFSGVYLFENTNLSFHTAYEAIFNFSLANLHISPVVLWFYIYGKHIKAYLNQRKNRRNTENA